MNTFHKYPLVMGVVSALTGLLLYVTYAGTKDEIARQEANALDTALAKVFFFEKHFTSEYIRDDKGAVRHIRVWAGTQKQGEPNYVAAIGTGVGYNAGRPIQLLVGFSNPAAPAPRFAARKERVVVGWYAVSSEETPGLGEKIKDSAPRNSLLGYIEGDTGYTGNDLRTPFQRQFSDPEKNRLYTASELKTTKSGGPIDIITGATLTTNGVIAAIRSAESKLP